MYIKVYKNTILVSPVLENGSAGLQFTLVGYVKRSVVKGLSSNDFSPKRSRLYCFNMLHAQLLAGIYSNPSLIQEIKEAKELAKTVPPPPNLPKPESGRIFAWFESSHRLSACDVETFFYSKPECCMEPGFLQWTFFTMDRAIIRQAMIRSQAGWKKEVGTTSKSKVKILVGSLQEPQWNAYKQSKEPFSCDSNCHFVPRKMSKTGFGCDRLEERTEMLIWDASSNHEFPPLAGVSQWYLNKWMDDTILWRAWLIKFAIKWNSYNGTVQIAFEYRTQHYVEGIWNMWVDN